MTVETAGPELIAAQVVRALGQPFIMITISNFATLGVPPTQATQRGRNVQHDA
jgi:DHA2 family multidrug resistance protein